MIGSWEFSNADRDRTCTATLKSDSAPGGLKIEFDANCANLFPLVRDITAWKFPDNDLLYFVDARGKTIVEFSEVEDGIFEAPTPGVGMVVHEATLTSGFGAELVALVQESCFYHLETPIVRVTGWDTPYPHAQEWDYFPGPARVGRALIETLEA